MTQVPRVAEGKCRVEILARYGGGSPVPATVYKQLVWKWKVGLDAERNTAESVARITGGEGGKAAVDAQP